MTERARERSITSILLQIVGPALIMLMVGSLVWLVVAMFYRGPHEARLCLVLGLFVFAAVLVSRIGVSEGRERGAVFAVALAVATFITSSTLVTFESAFGFLEPLALVGFIGLALWSVNRLTWDCTVIDRSRDVSSIGLTEVVKRKLWGRRILETPPTATSVPADGNAESEPQNARSDAQAGNLILALLSGGQQKNTPGLWVFYFSVFALPLFALGQWFVPATHQGYVIGLFGLYLAAGLGLMTTTSLLGLQRYLNQRNVELPYHVAVPWMLVGGGVGLACLFIVLGLPRLNVESSVRNGLAWFSSQQRSSSDLALGSDGQEQRKGANQKRNDLKPDESAGDGKSEHQGGKQSGNQKQGPSGSQKGQGQSSNSQSQSGNQSSPSSQPRQNSSGPPNSKSNSPQNNANSTAKSQPANSSPPAQANNQSQSEPNQASKQDAVKSKDQQNQSNSESPQSQPFKPEDPNVARDRTRREAAERKREEDEQKKNSNSNSSQSSSSFQSSNPSSTHQSDPNSTPKLDSLNAAAGMITALVYLLGVAAIVLSAILFRKELLAAWREFMAALQAWFSGKPKGSKGDEILAPHKPTVRRKTFSEFRNPFDGGLTLALPELINYTFKALEALGSDLNWPRSPDLTPLEYAEMAVSQKKSFDPTAKELALLVGQLHFAREQLTGVSSDSLRKIWQVMDRAYAENAHPRASLTSLATHH